MLILGTVLVPETLQKLPGIVALLTNKARRRDSVLRMGAVHVWRNIINRANGKRHAASHRQTKQLGKHVMKKTPRNRN